MRSHRMVHDLCVWIIFATLLCSCSPPATPSEGKEAGQLKSPDPPPTPSEFREFTLDPLPKAAEASGRVFEQPGDPDLRTSLGDIYEEAGYAAAAEFYRASADLLRGKEPRFDARDSGVAWVYPARDEDAGPRHFRKALEIEELLLSGSYAEAAQAAERALQEEGFPPRLVAEWAYAWLYAAVTGAEGLEVNSSTKERALRLYLTAVEEGRALPGGLVDQYAAYEMLGKFLEALEDPAAAWVAIATARDRLDEAESLEESERQAVREELTRELSSVEQAIRSLSE